MFGNFFKKSKKDKEGPVENGPHVYSLSTGNKVEGNFKNFKKHGIFKFYSFNGKFVQIEENYKDGVMDGLSTSFDDNGKLESKFLYKNGKRHGLSQFFFPDGTTRYNVQFVNGEQHGLSEYFFKDGQIESKFHYKEDLRHGEYELWFEDNKIKETGNYIEGIKDEYITYFRSGKYLCQRERLKHGHHKVSNFWDDGTFKNYYYTDENGEIYGLESF
tara:strand:+ start:902 stop:1549 length:648 start_codon:yes stop_codon:yes gene_type:complete